MPFTTIALDKKGEFTKIEPVQNPICNMMLRIKLTIKTSIVDG